MTIVDANGKEVFQEVADETQRDAFLNMDWKEVKEEVKEVKAK
jgi:hypothetical protein